MNPRTRLIGQPGTVRAGLAAGGQDDQRRRAVRRELAGDLEALDVGQADVEQDEVGSEGSGGLEAGRPSAASPTTSKPSAVRMARAWMRKPAASSTMRMVFISASSQVPRFPPTGLSRTGAQDRMTVQPRPPAPP